MFNDMMGFSGRVAGEAWKRRRLTLVSLMLFLMVNLTMLGCARPVDEQGNPIPPTPGEIAGYIRDGMDGLTFLSLVVVNQKAPEVLPKIDHQLMFTIAQLKVVLAENVTVGSVSTILTNLFNNLNTEFALLKNEDATLVLTTVTVVATMVQGYFTTVALPEDVRLYTEALVTGLETGRAKFVNTLPPPVEPAPAPADNGGE